MGDLLVLIFIGTVFFVSGFVLAFATGRVKGRKLGIVLLLIGLLIYLACWLFTPNNGRYRLFYDKHNVV